MNRVAEMETSTRWLRRLGIIGLLCWFVPSVSVLLVLSVLGFCEFLLSDSHPFPGDPPAADMLTEIALSGWLFILVGYVPFFVARKESDRILRLWRRVIPPLILLSFLAMSSALAQVGRRHWGEWGLLKAMLQDNEARVRRFSSRADGALSEEEFAQAKAWLLTQPATFHFDAESEPVRIHMRRTVPPYLGVDFGQGQNAVFDPVTMICIYSD
ncbi:hypothetical protein HI113_13480 [Corallococcus exiguus]|uniref:hypothetical protein n=1 Tax=Corallococcus TaxID=83461 RepID=UPI0011C348C5|nr:MULTISPECIES: hypothetical protein [Corallococcus]NNB86325.1 hypothetical protein [Corallococcus exiguus]NNB94908.1 hypothetical protein [Corallococcus exiguus]NPC47723.1 hypothetical protein [Corallococcus exiguus]